MFEEAFLGILWGFNAVSEGFVGSLGSLRGILLGFRDFSRRFSLFSSISKNRKWI